MTRIAILRILESYFRHRWLYLLPIILLSAAGIAFILNSKPKYVAGGIMYVQRESYLAALTAVRNNEPNWWVTASQATAQEISDLLRTDAFVRSIIQQTDLEQEMDEGRDVVEDTIVEVRDSVWASPDGENQVYLGAATDDPAISYQLVNALIEAYLQWRTNGQRAQSETAHDFLTGLIDQYQADLDASQEALGSYLVEHPEPLRGERPALEMLEIARMESDVDLANQRYISALNKDEEALLSLAQIESDTRQTYELIDAPRLPDHPEVSRREMAFQLGIFLLSGILFSLILIVVSALLDRTFRYPVDIQQSLNLPVLALIPQPQKQKRTRPSRAAKIEVVPQSVTANVQTDEAKPQIAGMGSDTPIAEAYHAFPKSTS